MNIEFRTIFDEISNEYLAQLYVKHFMDNQNKQYKKLLIFAGVLAAICVITGVTTKNYVLCTAGPLYLLLVYVIIRRAKKKVIPKSFIETNKIGCPYNVTFGFYDEYFYEKFENNMTISEQSIRYDFLKKIVETPDCFVLMTKRSSLFYLPKRDMGYENALGFSEFCKSRLPYIYQAAKWK